MYVIGKEILSFDIELIKGLTFLVLMYPRVSSRLHSVVKPSALEEDLPCLGGGGEEGKLASLLILASRGFSVFISFYSR